MNAWTAAEANPALLCEYAVLGAVLHDNKAYWVCAAQQLKPEHFESTLHGQVFQAMGAQILAGLEASAASLWTKLNRDEELKRQGGLEYFSRLLERGKDVANVAGYARAVQEWATRRKLLRLSFWIDSEVMNGERPLGELLAELRRQIDQCKPVEARGPVPFPQAVDKALATIERAYKRGEIDGVAFGLAKLDAMLGGAAKTDLVILAGRPGMGKSALAYHVAEHNARLGKRVVFFSLEMGDEQIAMRALSLRTRISADKLRRGAINQAQSQALVQAAGELKLPLFVDETGGIDPATLRLRLIELQQSGPVDLVVIDYLQLMRSGVRAENRVQEITAITMALKAIAKELGVPILALSQLNRAVEAREDKQPLLSDLRDSGSIEQEADIVIFVYREEYYLANAEPMDHGGEAHRRWDERMAASAGRAILTVAKHRHGPTGQVTVGFEGELTRFHDGAA